VKDKLNIIELKFRAQSFLSFRNLRDDDEEEEGDVVV